MGMSYEQYWEQSPYLTVAYRKAYRIKRETENEQAWLQGLYVFDAFAVALCHPSAAILKQNGQVSPIGIHA